MASTAAALAKWSAYYSAEDGRRPPWESGAPATYVLALVEEGLLPRGARVVELGSGVAATSIHLARLGYDCLAVDLVPAAIERGRALEAALWAADAGGGGDQDGGVVKQRVEWVAGDMFTSLLPERVPEGSVGLVIDIQCLHVFGAVEERRRLADLVYRLLRPGGLALVVTGNAEEPPREPGPPALTRAEVLAPFLCSGSSSGPYESAAAGPSTDGGGGPSPSGRFRLRRLSTGRFDPTPAYGPTPPLCWVALFERLP